LATAALNGWQARVEQTAYLGERMQLRVRAAGDTVLDLAVLPAQARGVTEGSSIDISVPPDQVVILREDGNA
jgi:hypothetical protein